MAGSIPPLVSSSPPPLCAFDDEEEDDDEFGVYAAAEELDYNECISYNVSGEEKKIGSKARGEHDSTSQDSATDSGLCPDSEGMSPTPHSDEERPGKQLPIANTETETISESECDNTSTSLGLPNGHHVEEDSTHVESNIDFGNFEFAPALSALDLEERNGVSKSPFKNCDGESPKEELDFNLEDLNNKQINLVVQTTFEERTELKLTSSKEGQSSDSTKSIVLNGEDDSFVGFQDFGSRQLLTAHGNELSSQCDVPKSNVEPVLSIVNDTSLRTEDSFFCDFPSLQLNDISCQPNTESLNCNSSCNDVTSVSGDPKQSKTLCQEEDLSFQSDDEFDDFTDFKGNFSDHELAQQIEKSDKYDKVSDQFEQFSDPTVSESSKLPPKEESDDEFSNFADFSSSDCAFVTAQSSSSLEPSTSHFPTETSGDDNLRTDSDFQDWVSVFPSTELVGESEVQVSSSLLTPQDTVWSRLLPLEMSHALTHHWADSIAYQNLLTALNIDSRNILLPWSAVPRFAATLGRGPLEPVKAPELPPAPPLLPVTVITPTVAVTQTSSTQEIVPDAHFDWGSSGLTNPLDCPKSVLKLPKTISAEAKKILDTLPDLSFMRKSYLVFPIKNT